MIETTLLGSALAVQSATFQVVDSVDSEWRQRFFEALERGRHEGLDYEELRRILIAVRPLTAVGNIQYRVFKTADSYIVVGALSAALRKKLCAAIGVADKRIGDASWDPMTWSREYAKQLVATAEGGLSRKTIDAAMAFDQAAAGAPSSRRSWSMTSRCSRTTCR
jgi:hypothetical protein